MTQVLPKIIPINELKNTAQISKICQESSVPIVVTKNGYGEMVMMSIDLYNETVAKLQAAVMLQHSIDEVAAGAQPEKAADYFNKAREKYGKQI